MTETIKKKEQKEEPGKTYDAGKLRFDLLPTRPMEEIVRVLSDGAEKYGDDNWRLGMSWKRHFGSAMRHMWKWFSGETVDPESKLHHLAHAAVRCMFLMEYFYCKIGIDNRTPSGDGTSRVGHTTRPLDLSTKDGTPPNASTYGY